MVAPDQLLAEFDTSDDVDRGSRAAVVENNHEQRMQAALKHLQTAARIDLDATLAAWERSYIEAALELCGGNVSGAARRLGINRTTLYNRMESWHRL
jgi:two-component system nitrogen regulation response regulator GlnG